MTQLSLLCNVCRLSLVTIDMGSIPYIVTTVVPQGQGAPDGRGGCGRCLLVIICLSSTIESLGDMNTDPKMGNFLGYIDSFLSSLSFW
jgi:hypothetical protein